MLIRVVFVGGRGEPAHSPLLVLVSPLLRTYFNNCNCNCNLKTVTDYLKNLIQLIASNEHCIDYTSSDICNQFWNCFIQAAVTGYAELSQLQLECRLRQL